MTKTKHSLLMSVIALILCASMLIGTTFAWFTDSVTSSNNIIKSGTLSISLSYIDDINENPQTSTAWKNVEEAGVKNQIFDYSNWEPGFTQIRHIKIENKGSLALKYLVNFVPKDKDGNVINDLDALKIDGVSLADVIDVYYFDPAVQIDGREDLEGIAPLGTLSEVLAGLATSAQGTLEKDGKDIITLALKMKESAGNKYQGKTVGASFDIQLFATQLNSEKDSIDENYDKASTYPASTTEKVKGDDAIEAGDVAVTLPAGLPEANYTLDVDNTAVTTDANGDTTAAFDITLLKDGVKVEAVTGVEYEVEIYVGKSLNVAEVTHNGTPVTPFDYNATTGIVSFVTDSFSPFTVTYYSSEAETVEDIEAIFERGGENITLTSDINLTGINWEPIASYSGVFDGAGHTISNLTVNSTSADAGMFASLNGATVKNLILKDVNVTTTGNRAGALAGQIEKKPDAPQTIIENVTVSGAITGNYYTGGIVGADRSYNTLIKNCENTATVNGGQQAGGIVGQANRLTVIDSCSNSGSVNASYLIAGGIIGMIAGDDKSGNEHLSVTIMNCSNTGTVSDSQGTLVGGIAGAIGRDGGDPIKNTITAYIVDCDVADSQEIYGAKYNYCSGKDEKIVVYVGDKVAPGATTVMFDAIKALGAGESKAFFLTDGKYTGNLELTEAKLGSNKYGDISFVALPGTTPVMTGTVTLGYRHQNVGAASLKSNVTFNGITFDHAEAEKHCLNVQDVESFNMINCTLIGDGEYGLASPGSNGTGASKIENSKFVNAGLQINGKFSQYLVIDGCEFDESVINVQGGGPLGPTIQNSTFDITLKDAHDKGSFYVIRNSNAGANITVSDCDISVDSAMTFEGTAGSKGWGVFVNRIASYDITAEDVAITMTDAALEQPELNIAKCLSTGKINMTNVTVNGVAQ